MKQEQAAIRRAIETFQQSLYPWITESKDDKMGYSTFFDLIDSFKQDAGIVIAAGKNGGFRWAIHQIAILREVLNSTLPIEIFYAGDEDLPEDYRNFIQMIADTYSSSGSIEAIDITKKFPDPNNVLGLPAGWAMRPFAMLASSFKTVILSDADTVFVDDPRLALREPNFEDCGSIFWYDRDWSAGSKPRYDWVDKMLAEARAKYLDRYKNQGFFRRVTTYEMERYVFSSSNFWPSDFVDLYKWCDDS